MDKKNIVLFRIFNRFFYLYLIRGKTFSKTHINYVSAIIYCIADRIRYIFVTFIPIWYGPYCHNPDIGSDTFHSQLVIPVGGYDASYVSAMESIGSFHISITIVAF